MQNTPSAATIISWVLLIALALPANALAQPLVMIDPGHGGRDSGAVGIDGLAEKTLVLDLAQRLAAALSPHCRAALTRTQDRSMPLEARAAAANRTGATLFVSLHAGAAIDTKTAFQTVFYHQWSPSTVPAPAATSADAVSWDHIQDRHMTQSRHLAETLARALAQTPKLPLPLSTQVRAAPLSLLKGVDMPAVVVEVGHLTHPLMTDWLNDPAHLGQLARTMAGALIIFLGLGSK